MVSPGLRSLAGQPAAPPYAHGPYTWDQQVTFTGGVAGVNSPGSVFYVDGTNGTTGGPGTGWSNAFSTIQAAVTAAGGFGTVFVAAKAMAAGATDPASYEENVIIPATHEGLAIIGVSRGRTQGGLPQMKDGTGTTTAILIIRAPGCLIMNMGFNGSGNTGGGILLDDDASTKSAFGTTIAGCHFKNCKGHATNGKLGGAIMWSAAGGAWQVLISGNKFYKCVADIVLLGTGSSRPQDVVIENNLFSGPIGSVDVNIYLAAGSGMDGVYINNNIFPCDPNIGSGTTTVTADLTGCVGTYSNNYHGHTGLTLGDGSVTGAVIPATVFMINNFQEDAIIVRTS